MKDNNSEASFYTMYIQLSTGNLQYNGQLLGLERQTPHHGYNATDSCINIDSNSLAQASIWELSQSTLLCV